ncbi:MAG TPA: PAS domain S-box protein [Vicinamibacterales bacterium]|nr:PAS domain S-box protein [Vicinamibacterales bacterium]
MPDRLSPRDSVALLEATLEATHDGIVVVDLNRRVVLWNRNIARMLNLTDDTIAAGVDAINAALAPQIENGDELRATSKRLWADPQTPVLDTLRFKDGRVFERFIAPHRVGDDVVWLVASVHDVTERANIQHALEQNRAFLEKAQEVAHIGSWVAELDGSQRVDWSRETSRIFGIDGVNVNGHTASALAFVHPDDREPLRAAAQAAIASTDRYETEHRIVRADGSVRWVHERADIVRDADHRPLRMIGTIQDITDRRQLEDQLRQAQKMEAIGRLAGGIAHDINNALTAIAGYSELALGAVAADHPARADVEEIRRAAERAGSVTRQLLAFSRKQLIEPRLFDVNDTVAAMARLLSRLVGADVTVRTQLGTDLRPVVGDPGQLEQAIVNLALNARDAMPSGGEVSLVTSLVAVDEEMARRNVPMPPGEYVHLAVSDTGHGMTAETQARIFEPFFTTKPAGKGTGLGLSMVYGTLKQIGGFVFVSSELGRGTTFNLYIPPAPGARADASRAPDASSASARATILVAEDEPAVRQIVASTLRADYDVLLAASGDEALAIADTLSGPPDLLLTDAVMPGKSGVEVAARLVEKWPALRVMFMSGFTDEDLSLSRSTHPVGVIQKPFTPRDLRARVREALASAG